MKFKFTNQDKEYEIEIVDGGQVTKIIVNGNEFSFGGNQPAGEAAAVAQTVLPRRDLSDKTVKAVLAGVITEISVNAGDIIKPGQKLLTLSAMKMENEILSERDGKIKEIKVTKDQKVKEGDILIVLV